MDLYRFNKKKNRVVFLCWIIIAVVLTVAYIIELLKGNRDLYYVMQFILFTWLPIFVCYGICLIIGQDNLNIKYGICIGYILFYGYTMATTVSMASFVYIIPMVSILIVYNDYIILDIVYSISFIINVLYIIYNITEHGLNNVDLTFYEIQIACILLSLLFIHKATKLLAYGNSKLIKLNEEVAKDELTNVFNRHYLKGFVDEKFRDIELSDISLAVIDIDDFKNINDTYGHKFGDLVLKRLANTLKEFTQEYQETIVARIGGDEFVIISTLVDKVTMYEICINICNKISKTKLKYGSKEVELNISIGVANSVEDECTNYEELYEKADSLLYLVKKNGKNSVAKE